MSTLFVVGIGPGKPEGITVEAREALAQCDLICGYTEYIKLIEPLFPGVATLATPMMREIERCRLALEAAAEGKRVAMVCSGDAGVYGMASPILELWPSYPGVEIEVVSGVTAAQSGSAVLGAPLSHDYAVISLSDLLTPWEVIEKRLRVVAEADFCLCLYNPRSKKRSEHLARACALLREGKAAETVCGWVRNIGREGQEYGIVTLEELATFEADMFTTIFVGNRETVVIEGRIVTPRGYKVER